MCVFVLMMEVVEVFGEICKCLLVLLVVDIYFDYKIVLCVVDLGVDCLRINFGNIGFEVKICEVVVVVCYNDIFMCIGVNVGLLEKDI